MECLSLIRSQSGGLNRNTPVIVLTANAGSENQELYRAAGFDGYLCKPVSGDQLESTLLIHLPKDKIIRSDEDSSGEDVVETEMFVRKAAVAITTSSMCDLPAHTLRNLNIGVIPYKVSTDKGVFLDEREIEAGEVIRYLENSDRTARTQSPEIVDLEQFFASQLNRAGYVIHITSSGKEADIDYIKDNHESFMKQYMNFKKILRDVVGKEGKDDEKTRLPPTADSYIIDGVYEAVREAAETMDIEAVEAALKEVEGYVLPKEAETDFKKIKSLAEDFDYDGILLAVKEREA